MPGTFIEFLFTSQDIDHELTARLYVPGERNATTGLTTLVHGWGCDRQQYDHLGPFCEAMNLFGLQIEYRDSGREARMGRYNVPYDLGKLQVIDTLRAVHDTLRRFPEIDQRRLFLIGGSGGGHNVLQAMAFAPHTFAATIALSPISRPTNQRDVEEGGYAHDFTPGPGTPYSLDIELGWGSEGWALGAGNHFSPDEWDIRNSQHPDHVAAVRCPVILIHTLDDETVDVRHSLDMAQALIYAGKRVSLHIIDRGDDGGPVDHVACAVSPILKSFPIGGLLEQYASRVLLELQTDGRTDFVRQKTVSLGRWQISYADGIPALRGPHEPLSAVPASAQGTTRRIEPTTTQPEQLF